MKLDTIIRDDPFAANLSDPGRLTEAQAKRFIEYALDSSKLLAAPMRFVEFAFEVEEQPGPDWIEWWRYLNGGDE